MKLKKTMLCLMAAASIGGTATAQTIAVNDVEAVPGETVAYTLTIDVAGGTHKGFQYEMQFPESGFTLNGTTVSGEWNGASFAVGDLDENGWTRASAFSLSDTKIPDGQQEIGTVLFTVGTAVPYGNYDVTISQFDFLDGDNYVRANDVTFHVNVVSIHNVTLDETSTTLPVASNGEVNVRVNRTINAGEWSTIVLPFAMTEEQVKEAFGEDVQLGDFSSWSSEEDDEGNIVAISVGFDNVTKIDANHPYIIKISSPITEFNVDGVNIEVENEPTVQVGTKKAERGYFIGTYVAQTEVPAQTLFLNDNKFWYSVGKTKMKAFRAYFEFYDVLSEVENISAQQNVRMFFNDDNTTGITSTDNPQLATDESIYDLQGRRISEASESGSWPSALKSGIYVRHGKKVIIK